MNVLLAHIDWAPMIYGVCLFLSFMSMAWKIKHGKYIGFIAEVLVVALILIIHGGSVTGGFAATIAGLLCGWAIPIMFPSGSSSSSTPVEEPVSKTFTPWELHQLTKEYRSRR